VIERCLAKDPEERYASTKDLARELEMLRRRLGEASGSGETAAASGDAASERFPTFHRLTFRRGTILSARFAPDGQTVIYGASWEGQLSHLRVSPDGARVAFLHHPTQGDDGGEVMSVDRAGARAVMTSDNGMVGIMGARPGEQEERDLSLLDWSLLRDISRDGKAILFDEPGEFGGHSHGVYVRRTDGSPAVRLGEGVGASFSPDGSGYAYSQHRILSDRFLVDGLR